MTGQAVAQHLTDGCRVRQQALCVDRLDHREGGRGRHRVAPERGAVVARLQQ
jgi:hypothetical protein